MKYFIKRGFGIAIGVCLANTAIDLLQTILNGITEGITEGAAEHKGSK